MKYYLQTIFIIAIFTFSTFADEWKPGEWLLTTPIYLPSPTKAERNKINSATKKKELFPKSFHMRMFNELPKKILPKPNTDFITQWGTTRWEIVASIGECPTIEKPVPECSVFFAAKYWISPKTQLAELWFGSDDAATVWLNNEKIITHTGNRAYKFGGNVVQVSLKQGTNIFVFAVINGEGPGMVGAHLFPKDFPIQPGLFLDREKSVETDNYIELNFYWYPSAIVKPRKRIYDNKPKCEEIKILDFSNSIVTQIIKKDIFFPLSINMHGRSNGIYKIESEWNGEIHTRSFYYCGFPEKLTPSEEWKIEFLKYNDFFRQKLCWSKCLAKKISEKQKEILVRKEFTLTD